MQVMTHEGIDKPDRVSHPTQAEDQIIISQDQKQWVRPANGEIEV